MSTASGRAPGALSGRAVQEKRIERDIEAVAAFTEEDPRIGCSRPTFSPAWRRARDYLLGEARSAGCRTWVDAAGNGHARPQGLADGQRAWLCGSHVDSVPTGGRFDGVVGVVVALEVLRVAPEAPVELVVFAEEEGTTFNLGMLGSRAWAGTLDAAQLGALTNRNGQTYLGAGEAHGVKPDRLGSEHLRPGQYLGMIEVHIEQGPGLWKAGAPLAVVTGISGRRQYSCSLRGDANHAGSTRMTDRRDALAGAAQLVCSLEALGRELDRETAGAVITVGRLDVQPGAVNVIPGKAAFTVDFRSPSNSQLARGDARVRAVISTTASDRNLELGLECTEEISALPLDEGVCGLLRAAARRLGMDLPNATSGALHDTAILAPFLPAAMLFVASRDGISHNPGEFSSIEHIAMAARVVAEAVRP
ncbi:MAG TPA: M20 family metallo-hydrolase [Spirochaetia bacterium]|nr:M20 family metallo-hydrolase [Spirochaetia bacterium]